MDLKKKGDKSTVKAENHVIMIKSIQLKNIYALTYRA